MASATWHPNATLEIHMRFRIFIRSMLVLSIAFAVASSPNQLSARQTPGTPPPAAATPIVATESALPYLFGNALPLLPPGDTELVEVIAFGLPVRSDVPVAVRNNTGEDVVLKGVFGIALGSIRKTYCSPACRQRAYRQRRRDVMF